MGGFSIVMLVYHRVKQYKNNIKHILKTGNNKLSI